MRTFRLKLNEAATYHVMSRVLEGRRILKVDEKGYMANLMRRMEVFTGCEVRTYAFLDNHFHILLHVPVCQELTDKEVKWRVRMLYGKKKYHAFEETWEMWEKQGQENLIKEQLDKFRVRMYDLSEFMKTFKQRITVFYNANSGHKGPLWWDRFKSVLVEESEHAQMVVAAYIDLNPVRAGIVVDPKDYRWSGYGEAVAGIGESRSNLCKLFTDDSVNTNESLAKYRQTLYIQGERKKHLVTGEIIKPGFSQEMVDETLNMGGQLSICQILRCKVRYFSDGAVIGSRQYVDKIFNDHNKLFNCKRKSHNAKQMEYGDWGGLYTAKKPRKKIIACVVGYT